MQTELIAGDSCNFPATASGYSPADGWALLYRLNPQVSTDAPILITAVVDGSYFRVQLTAAATAAWAPGAYSWAAWVERAGETYTVATGQLVIRPNPRTAGAGTDGRSDARRALDDALAAYRAFDPTRSSYTINGRTMVFNSAAEILTKVRFFQAQVDREDAAAGRLSPLTSSMGGRMYLRNS